MHPASHRPAWLMPALLAWIALVVAGYLAMSYAWDANADPDPAPALPSPTSSPTHSDECTAEDVAEDGACLTWDDIRDLEWHTEAP